ncbi:unnamed protein product, partial [marine sediment metagenome]
GFLNHEFKLLKQGLKPLNRYCEIIDTLQMARQKHPGQRNSLDALCKRYQVDSSARDLHGALLDARLLGLVYLAMTGGQTSLFAEEDIDLVDRSDASSNEKTTPAKQYNVKVIRATNEETKSHEDYLARMQEKNGGACVWETEK